MNYIDFTNHFFAEFEKQHNPVEIKKYHNREKSLIQEYPYRNIEVEIKPNSTGIFVINLSNFEFFDNKLLEEYLRCKLQNNNATFVISSHRIYIYPKDRNNIYECLDILNYTTNEILVIIKAMKSILQIN